MFNEVVFLVGNIGCWFQDVYPCMCG